MLRTVFLVDFIHEGHRYKFTATHLSVHNYLIFINGSKCAVGVRNLADGGLLILLAGQSHNVYQKEEPAATRLSIDGKTCMLEQENDASQLRTPSPRKLVKFLVDNGEHLKAGQAFAKMDVCHSSLKRTPTRCSVQITLFRGSSQGRGRANNVSAADFERKRRCWLWIRVVIKKTPDLKWREEGFVIGRFGALRRKTVVKNVLSEDV